MNRTRMVATSISTILRRIPPSTSRGISFVASHSHTLLHRQTTFSSSLEHSSSVLPISVKNFPLKLQLFGGNFCSKSGDKTNSRCWNCDASLEKILFVFCDSCGCVQPVDDSVDYFHFFGLEKKNEVDIDGLLEKFEDWIPKLSPDLFLTKSEKEYDYAAEQGTKLCMAYRNLLSPRRRAVYLMELNGIDVSEEMIDVYMGYDTDPKLLKEIMEIRKAIKEANDSKAAEQIESQIEEKMNLWSDSFGKAFESQKFDEAVACIGMMTNYDEADREIRCKKRELCCESQN